MKYFYIKSLEGIRFITAAANKEDADVILKKAFEKGDYWGYDPNQIVELDKLPMEISPGVGEIIQISSYRV